MRSKLGFRSAFFASCALAVMIGCGGSADDTGGEQDTGVVEDATDGGGGDAHADSGKDTGVDAPKDSVVADTAKDSTADSVVDSSVDSGADTAPDTTPEAATDSGGGDASDAADAGDAGDASGADADADVVADTGVDTAICAPPLCSDSTICVGGTACTPCTTDTQCSTIAVGTLCFGGKCLVGTCHPKPATSSGCTTGQACCATSSSAGTCFSASSGGTACCDDTDCAAVSKTTKCDTTTHTCVCPDPAPGALFVGSQGSDIGGNGSSACPFQTITHAITVANATPTTTWTIDLLEDNPGGTTTTYGAGCTAGGAACDATQITIPHTLAGLTIQGTAAAGEVIVKGGTVSATDKSVFFVQAPGVSFKHLTVQPMLTSATGGAAGILIDAPSATTEGSITDVVVLGISATPVSTAFTGDAVLVRGGSSPTIGPAFVVSGGGRGLNVSQATAAGGTASAPTLTSATALQTSITNTVLACVRVETVTGGAGPVPTLTVTSADPATPVHLSNCNGLGGIVVDVTTSSTAVSISKTKIDATTGAPPFAGVHLLSSAAVTMSDTSITDLAGTLAASATNTTGIVAEGTSSLSITSNVHSQRNGRGAFITGTARATITGLIATNNALSDGSDGLRCDASTSTSPFITITVRSSYFLGNHGNGVSIAAGCSPDFGDTSPTGAGNNVFNTSTQANLISGVCATGSGLPFTLTTSDFKCTTSPSSACIPATSPPNFPSTNKFAICAAATDVSGTSITILGASCCHDVTVP